MEPKVSAFKVPERHRKWVDIAEELARDAFAPRAAMVDEENRFPFENYDDLRASGLLPLMVPERFGGIGADSFTYATVLSKIAQGCASTGLTFNMHSAILFFLRQIATPAQQERYFGEVVTDGAVFSSITSEPGISFRHKGRVRTHIERDGDGYRLTGRKIFCFLSTGATYYFTWSFLEGAESLADGLLTVLIPTGRDGITILDDWNTLGMRGTASNSIDFESVRIEPDDVIGEVGGILGQNMSIWSVGYTAVYIGIAEAAFEYCVNAMRAPRSDGSPPRSEDPFTWQEIGKLSMQLEARPTGPRHAGVPQRRTRHRGSHLRAQPGQVPGHRGGPRHHHTGDAPARWARPAPLHSHGALPAGRHGRPGHAPVQRALPGDRGQARPRPTGQDNRVRVIWGGGRGTRRGQGTAVAAGGHRGNTDPQHDTEGNSQTGRKSWRS